VSPESGKDEKGVAKKTAPPTPGNDEKDGTNDSASSPAELVRLAGDTVETAHTKLELIEHPDAVSEAFEEELDVLAEMTLSLRQKCKRLEGERLEGERAEGQGGGDG
jgi:hypothetical protein